MSGVLALDEDTDMISGRGPPMMILEADWDGLECCENGRSVE